VFFWRLCKGLADVAFKLGVEVENILLESVSKETEDQAQNIRKILKLNENERFVMVTSASHMPRAVAFFRSFSMQSIPAPIDFWIKNQKGVNPKNFFPTASS